MPITAQHVSETVTAYLDAHPEEKPELSAVLALVDEGAEVTSRKEFRGHATAGAVLVDRNGKALFIHHVALGKWLTPGGHLEPEDDTLSGAALRELTEETGISPEGITLVDSSPVHIDVHPIPANDAKGEPAHQHIDFRFLFRTAEDTALSLQEEEVSGYAWRDADTIADGRLRTRVLSAVR
ncbi:NUDIX hydrolase [Kitasatospora sp. YST-16]|uniref:NUDIX hydrolase n=1 Tax=unclassified Kitasatospora TaxID=2633591 RepID=UPI0004C3C873|nr:MULTISPECIES: NUDIX hydrolase [unclassified Kitasatospora]WAL74767.1 NUDIX hydrolase [Kitasatospora sp. YST-16]WNW40821.1 NUDIX hydrolase [Streptomyces sp. Li-HN-5-13]